MSSLINVLGLREEQEFFWKASQKQNNLNVSERTVIRKVKDDFGCETEKEQPRHASVECIGSPTA